MSIPDDVEGSSGGTITPKEVLLVVGVTVVLVILGIWSEFHT